MELYRFASPLDKLFMFIGTLGALGNGLSMPFSTTLFSGFIQIFIDYSIEIQTGTNVVKSAEILEDNVRTYAIRFIILGCFIFICGNLQMSFWIISGER